MVGSSSLTMQSIFDTYLFVDWNASNRPTRIEPKKDAIWIGELEAGASVPETTYHRTRRAAVGFVQERLEAHRSKQRRILVGFDFPYGYPRGTGRSLGLDRRDAWLGVWQLLAEEIEDSRHNVNNRWQIAASLNHRISPDIAGPFWGCPKSQQSKTLSSRRIGHLSFPYALPNGGALRELRHPERRLSGTQEVWKLLGAGSVGSQTLVGIPCVHRLRFSEELEEHSLVWPYETGFSCELFQRRRPLIVHAEIWPGVVEAQVRADGSGRIRDQVQVEQLCLWASREDRSGTLRRRLERPSGLSDDEVRDCLLEEGWILGA